MSLRSTRPRTRSTPSTPSSAIDVGPENSTDMAKELGITSPLERLPGRGARRPPSGVSVLEMSNAYATFANGGVHHDPTAIAKVEFPDGEVDEPPRTPRATGCSPTARPTGRRRDERTLDCGTATAAKSAARPRQDRHDRGADRRLVRRLHAARLDGGLDRQPRRPYPAARLRRRPLGADLARVHGRGRLRALRRLPDAREPGRALGLLQRAHASRRSTPTTTTDTTTDTRTTTDDDDDPATDDAPAARRLRPRPVRARGRPGAAPAPTTDNPAAASAPTGGPAVAPARAASPPDSAGAVPAVASRQRVRADRGDPRARSPGGGA